MTQFEAFEDGVEIDGQVFRSMLAGVGGLSNVFEKQTRESMGKTDQWSEGIGYYESEAMNNSTELVSYKDSNFGTIDAETVVVEQFDPERTLVGTEAERDQWRIEDGNECVYRIAQ